MIKEMRIFSLTFSYYSFNCGGGYARDGCQNTNPVPDSSSSSLPTTPIPTTAKECYEQGIELKNKQQSSQAILLFSEAIKLDPAFKEAYY